MKNQKNNLIVTLNEFWKGKWYTLIQSLKSKSFEHKWNPEPVSILIPKLVPKIEPSFNFILITKTGTGGPNQPTQVPTQH